MMDTNFCTGTPFGAGQKVNFSFSGKEYSLELKYNISLIEFYKNYPYCDLSVYFNSSPSQIANNSLKETLSPFIKDKSIFDAVSFLLNFVQYATAYQIDDEQFGIEKPFFVEESLHYHSSDCEDRAVFFAYLVKELVGLKVIGIDFPNHVAAAVNFKENFPGTNFNYKNKKYTLCDPTYLGAGVGAIMPEYSDKEAEIIELK